MKCSELTLENVIEMINIFCPCKIIYNDKVLYNDYDSDNLLEFAADGSAITGEEFALKEIVPHRILGCEDNIITSINIDIVDFHHSIITLKGE